MYEVMGEPLLDEGSVQVTTDWESALAVAETLVGAPGAAAGVTADELADGRPVPDGLAAVTATA